MDLGSALAAFAVSGESGLDGPEVCSRYRQCAPYLRKTRREGMKKLKKKRKTKVTVRRTKKGIVVTWNWMDMLKETGHPTPSEFQL